MHIIVLKFLSLSLMMGLAFATSEKSSFSVFENRFEDGEKVTFEEIKGTYLGHCYSHNAPDDPKGYALSLHLDSTGSKSILGLIHLGQPNYFVSQPDYFDSGQYLSDFNAYFNSLNAFQNKEIGIGDIPILDIAGGISYCSDDLCTRRSTQTNEFFTKKDDHLVMMWIKRDSGDTIRVCSFLDGDNI